MEKKSLIALSQAFVLDYFNRKDTRSFLYHNYRHTAEVVDTVQTIIAAEQAPIDAEALIIAAWFHDIGYLDDPHEHEERSKRIAQLFLEEYGMPAERIEKVKACIEVTKLGSIPSTLEESIIMDADTAFGSAEHFLTVGPMLRLEWEYTQERKMEDVEWERLQLQYLLGTKFYTDYGKRHFEPFVAQNTIHQHNIVQGIARKMEKRNLKVEAKQGLFNGIEQGAPERAAQTFFKTTFRNHINLSSIADNKASMLISVNSILISVIISMLSYSKMAQEKEAILTPIICFLVTSLTSLIFAVLAARPTVTTIKGEQIPFDQLKKSISFFGVFAKAKIEDFEAGMDEMLKDSNLIYGNMTRDLYKLGKVLDKKFRLLKMAFNIFMLGFAVAVLGVVVVVLLT